MKRLLKKIAISNSDLDIQISNTEIRINLKNKDEALHEGPWGNSKVRNMTNEPEDFIGYINWRVTKDTIYVGELEIREEYHNTNLFSKLLNTFKKTVVDPLISEYGKGNVYLSTGFANQQLWDMLDRVISRIGLKWANSQDQMDNTGAFKLRELLLDAGANVLGGVVVANFPVDRYYELYQEAYGTDDLPMGYWFGCIATNGDFQYSVQEYDARDFKGFTYLYMHTTTTLTIEDVDQELLQIYKNNPQLVDNLYTVFGDNGNLEIGLDELYADLQFSDKEGIKQYFEKVENYFNEQ